MIRKILFESNQGVVVRTQLDLPGKILNPPKILVYQEKIYLYNGSG